MASFATWYNHQYASWNRVRSLHQSPYIARVDPNASRAATTAANNMAETRLVVDMNAFIAPVSTAQAPAPSASGTTTTPSQNDTLFGPNIGVLGAGPAWTERAEKSEDVLTPEIVKGWIAKSKETHYSTTTLQALVNLKRPTLRLSPLENDAESEDAEHEHHHALEFEYDCDAPKCAIRVYVMLSPKHPMAGKVDASGYARTLVFETVTDGGFGKTLKFEDGAMLELGRFDHQRAATPTGDAPRASSSADPEKTGAAETPSAEPLQQRKKRFTNFHFRKRNQDRSVAGPALAVVDADAQVTESEEKGKDAKDEDVGVRVTIRLSALDEEGKELPSPNEQVTYLHIVRFGAPPPALDGVNEEDKRPWVVKVVKREATIGLHTFHLHEIYGLSANSTTSAQPTAPPPTAPLDTHTYPPATPVTNTADDEPSSECLLCLSSPREVVLLPCRHLVACRECAVNMIEFGAGGTIVQADDPPAPGTDAPAADAPAAAVEGAAGAEGAPPMPAPVPTVITNPRRKRKAKGWFCPVCRQPYTSLLRITTTPPEKDTHRESTSLEDHEHVPPTSPVPGTPRSPNANANTNGNAPAVPPPTAQPERGRLGGLLRAFGRERAPQPDVERGLAPPPVAA